MDDMNNQDVNDNIEQAPSTQIPPVQQVQPTQAPLMQQQQAQSTQTPSMQPQYTQAPPRQMQYNNSPEKKSNKGLIIGLIIGGVVLLGIMAICVALIIGIIIYNIDDYRTEADRYDYEDYITEDIEDDYDDWEDDIDKTEEEIATQTEVETAYQRVGNDFVGYIDIPEDYYPYEEVGSEDSQYRMQYSDSSGLNVITIFAYEDTTAVGLADTVFGYYMEDAGVDEDSLEGSILIINECEMYRSYCYYPEDGIYLYTWCFETPDSNYVHYVAIESTDKKSNLFKLIETYSSVE